MSSRGGESQQGEQDEPERRRPAVSVPEHAQNSSRTPPHQHPKGTPEPEHRVTPPTGDAEQRPKSIPQVRPASISAAQQNEISHRAEDPGRLENIPHRGSPNNGDRTGAAMTIVLGVLAIGIGVGLTVGLTKNSALLGTGTGFGSALFCLGLMWLLFVPLKNATMSFLGPILGSLAATRSLLRSV